MINSLDPDPVKRIPDPQRLVRAYAHSAAAMNMIRAYARGGLADLHAVHDWNKDFVATSPAGGRYEVIAQEIDRALAFMKECGIDDAARRGGELYNSHEAQI